MVMFGWTQSQSIVYNGAIMAAFGVISLIVYLIYSYYGRRLQERDVIIVGMAMMTAFSLITFPYPVPWYPVSSPPSNWANYANVSHSFANSTDIMDGNLTSTLVHGCDTKKYSWCFLVPHVPLALYLSTFFLLAISFPAVNCAISTIFPKIIGPRRQVRA